ncbi:MAG: DsrE family protein [Pseudomonadota bacterium]|jgi:intracellular sulfur oxidation DsrE/DsrF family protein
MKAKLYPRAWIVWACLSLAAAGAHAAAEANTAIKSASAAKAKKAARHRVVIQVSDGDPKKWQLALNNARNVQTELGQDQVDIEIVAYGPGIGMLKADSEAAARVEEAVGSGMRVVACENTMTNQKLSRSDMNPFIGYVRAGVVEIMEKQRQGYAYLRP